MKNVTTLTLSKELDELRFELAEALTRIEVLEHQLLPEGEGQPF